jgi:hypothetical protein
VALGLVLVTIIGRYYKDLTRANLLAHMKFSGQAT